MGRLLHCMSPLMALSGHSKLHRTCPLSGVRQAANLSAPESRLLVSNYCQSQEITFSLINLDHIAQPHSNCEHFGGLGVARPWQIAKAFLASASGPRTAHDIRRNTPQGAGG
jgi:hypothetical protein